MAQPLLSILIPTRQRCETLMAAVDTCLDQDYDPLEVVVCDNCSTDATRELVQAVKDPRLRYVSPDRRLSMSGNFEFALAQARPGYVTMIGDDDGLMPGAAARVAALVEETGAEAVIGSSVIYNWPNYPNPEGRNRLLLPPACTGHQIRDSRRTAAATVAMRNPSGYIWGLPTLYRGFIATDVINRGRRQGRYFHSVTPDAYSAFVNSVLVNRCVYSQAPLTLEGVSGRSNGASQLLGRDGSEERAFLAEQDLPFHPLLQYAPSGIFILVEAFLQAREQFPQELGDLPVDLGRVCHYALRFARGMPNQIRVQAAVEATLAQHGLSVNPPPLPERLRERAARLRSVWQQREVDGDRYGVQDVRGAARLAARLLRPEGRKEGTPGYRVVLRKLAARLRRSPLTPETPR